MKAVITKDDVLKARDSLLVKGKPAGSRAIFGLLGRGSLGTITKFLREIEVDTPRPGNLSEIQEAFGKFWSMAVEAGKEHAEAQIKELKEAELGLIEETERLVAEQQSMQERVNELEKSHGVLTTQLRNALDEATTARASAESHASKFAEALERIERLQRDHANEIKLLREDSERVVNEAEKRIIKLQTEHATEAAELRGKFETTQSAAHKLEVTLARTEAKLEAVSQR